LRILLAFIFGIGIGAAAIWFLTTAGGRPHAAAAASRAQDAGRPPGPTVPEKPRVLDLKPQDLKDELARTGQVVRRTAREVGKAVADATADARITAAIKAKLVANPTLSALSISVNTTTGIVTLSGMVPSVDAIAQAMTLAMETDGVREVISTLQTRARSGAG
jgi:hypothetical protein